MGRQRHPRLGILSIITGIVIIIFALMAWSISSIQKDRAEAKRQQRLAEAIEFCDSLFEESTAIRSDTTADELTDCSERLAEITGNEEKASILREQVALAFDYLDWQESANQWFDENNLVKDSIQDKDLVALTENAKNIAEAYQPIISEKLNLLQAEYNQMTNAENAVNALFTSVDRATVRTNARRAEYNDAKALVDNLKQAGLKQNLTDSLAKVLPVIEEQERIAREKAEAARKAEEERRRKIAAAWTRLNIAPYYINQYSAGIINGCEAASLLMSLKFKGRLGGMDFHTFATNMPTHESDPNLGFYLTMFDLEPRDEAHWIAPGPLASYGVNASGASVINATGWSLDRLDQEVAAGNPVIIYLTWGFKEPKEYSKGVPKNLHVMVLSGYNSITGEQQFYDPWPAGNSNPTLSKARTEYLYRASGYRAVVVR